jgi:glutathione S-transferase
MMERAMSLTFYFAPMSTASITEAVLAELGTPCERVRLDLQAGDTRKPDFLEINPNGRVPAIVHDGTPIWESCAITMYLGEVFGVDAGLYPALGPKRGAAMKWIAWSNVTLAEPAGRLAASLPMGSDGAVEPHSIDMVPGVPPSASAADKARADLAVCLAVLDDGLEEKPFLLGEYSLADTHLQAIVGWLGMMQVDLTPFTHVTAWLRRCRERPALTGLMAG